MSPRSARPLKVFAFDPSVGRNFRNHLTLHVPYEPLEPGPIGRLVAVIDEDRTGVLRGGPAARGPRHPRC